MLRQIRCSSSCNSCVLLRCLIVNGSINKYGVFSSRLSQLETSVSVTHLVSASNVVKCVVRALERFSITTRTFIDRKLATIKIKTNQSALFYD